MSTAFGSARTNALSLELCGPANRLSFLLRASVRHTDAFFGCSQFRGHHTQLRRDRSMLDLVQVACNLVRSVVTIPHSERSQPCNGKTRSGHLHLSHLLVSSCVMLTTLSAYSFEDFEAVPVHVVVSVVRTTVVGSETGRYIRSVKPRTSSSGSSQPEHAVDSRTLAQGRSAPERMRSEKPTQFSRSRYYAHFVNRTAGQ